MNIGFLASHTGSNMQAIIDAAYRSGAVGTLETVDWWQEPSREPRS